MAKETKNISEISFQTTNAPKGFPYKFEQVAGKFVDYKGQTRSFTMVAVSVMNDSPEKIIELSGRILFGGMPKKELINEVMNMRTAQASLPIAHSRQDIMLTKGLYFGISVTKPEDEDKYDAEVGLRIALGRALNANKAENVHAVFATHPGMFSTESIRAMLMNEAKFFAENPGTYMVGYNEARDKHLSKHNTAK